jgi:hypothetical protein
MAERRTDVNPLYSKDAAKKAPAPTTVTPTAGTAGTGTATAATGTASKLAGPVPPDLSAVHDTPVMGVVPPEPSMPDEAGEIDFTHGDARRVHEEARGSATPDGELAAREKLRKELHREGATDVSESD